MKILIIDTTIHESLIGGGHLYLPKFIEGLIQRDHQVHMVILDEPNIRIAGLINDSGVILHKRPWKKKGIVKDLAPSFANWIHRNEFDIYLISGSSDIGWVTLPFLDGRIATFAIGHNDSETYYLPVRHYNKFLTGVIGVSPEISEIFKKECHVPSERIRWIPYGVTVKKDPPDPHKGIFRIVYAGRVVQEQKRISDIIQIIKQLCLRDFDFRFVLVGDGPDMDNLKLALKDEIETGIVILRGWLSNDDVIDQFKNSDVFVLTSSYEGFCISLIEAMANGCCPLVTEIRSGNKELVQNNINGFLLPVGDINGFVEKMIHLDTDRAELFKIRYAAWESSKIYSREKMTEAYLDFFNWAVDNVDNEKRECDPNFPLLPTCVSKYPDWIRRIKAQIVGN